METAATHLQRWRLRVARKLKRLCRGGEVLVSHRNLLSFVCVLGALMNNLVYLGCCSNAPPPLLPIVIPHRSS